MNNLLANPTKACIKRKYGYHVYNQATIFLPKGSKITIFKNISKNKNSDVIPIDVICEHDIYAKIDCSETGPIRCKTKE